MFTFIIVLMVILAVTIVYSITITKEINKLENEYLDVLKELQDLRKENDELRSRVYMREKTKRLNTCKNDNIVENVIDEIDPIKCRKELYARKILSEAEESLDFYNILVENIIDIDGMYCAINKSDLAVLMKEYDKFSRNKLTDCYMNINGKCYLTNKGINYVSQFSRLLLVNNDIVNNMLIFAIYVPNNKMSDIAESVS